MSKVERPVPQGFTAVGAGVFVVLGGLVVVLRLKPDVGMRVALSLVDTVTRDPDNKARAIAESVSETMNCGAWACMAGLLCSLVRAVARWCMSAMPG